MTETLIAQDNGTGSGSGSQNNAGADLLRNIQSTANAFEQGDWLSGGLGVVKVAMGVMDVAGDPLGAIGSAGLGWVLGAVSFLREPFDVLQGNSGAVSGSAQSWSACAGGLSDTVRHYRDSATSQTRSWTGSAADGYRAASNNQADGIAALSEASKAISGAMQQGGQAVAQARKTVMDLISDAVQKIIQICIEALSKSWMSFGASIAEGIAKSVQQAVQTAQKLAQEIQKLIQTLQQIIQVVQKVVQIAQQVKELVELIGGKASAQQPQTLSTQQITSTGAMATDTNPNGGGVPTASREQIASGFQWAEPAVAGANGTGGAAPGSTQTAASNVDYSTPTAAGTNGTGGQTTSTQTAATSGPVAAPAPVAGSGGTGGVPTSTAGASPVTGPVAAPPVAGTGGVQTAQGQPPVGQPVQAPPPAAGGGARPAVDPSRWPEPPRGVPSWGPTGPPPSEGTAAGPQQLREWIETARQILIQQGVDPSLMNADQMLGLIQHESSGNPHAINLWDSNATAGHPSKGLMQTIDSTFSEHHLPGYDSIYSPVDNILAGTRYAIERYGSISDVPGVRAVESGRGYVGY